MEGDRVLVFPENAAREFELASDFTADQAVTDHRATLSHRRERPRTPRPLPPGNYPL